MILKFDSPFIADSRRIKFNYSAGKRVLTFKYAAKGIPHVVPCAPADNTYMALDTDISGITRCPAVTIGYLDGFMIRTLDPNPLPQYIAPIT